MNKQRVVILISALAMVACTASGLMVAKRHQTLGKPGVLTVPVENSPRLRIFLPEFVLDYTSNVIPTDAGLLEGLPHDTSFMQRRYTNSAGFMTLLNVVLMGTDRTSIHKPEICLVGQGWTIDPVESHETTVHMDRPVPYDLPVTKLIASQSFLIDGKETPMKAIYVYWFVADKRMTARHSSRMLEMGWELLRTGVLQRWAYITCFSVCHPGQEDETFDRMQRFMRASVPQFQLVPEERKSAAIPPKQVADR